MLQTTEDCSVSKSTARKITTGDIKIHELIAKQLDAVKFSRNRNQRDVATMVGYDKPNMIAMFKAGTAKVPLDKVPQLAEALDIDPAFLMRLAMTQYWPEYGQAIEAVFGTILTKNEVEIIEKIRSASKNTDPELTREAGARLREIFGV